MIEQAIKLLLDQRAVRKVGTGTDAARRARAQFRNAGIHGVPPN
jgi:hypothetical protein